MDIFFCDECGARVTGLELRAGKGMRRRHAVICAGCVDQGLAPAWLERHAASNRLAVVGAAPLAAPSAVALADEPDPISIARDRAATQADDPFGVDEPAPQLRAAQSGTDTLRRPPAPVARPSLPPTEEAPPVDSLASAGGGFGALLGDRLPPPPPGLVDDPVDDRVDDGLEVADVGQVDAAPPIAEPETPFDYVAPADADNPGKAETTEVPPVKDHDRPSGKSSSGRQQSQQRRSTSTSKRTAVKPASTRRSPRSGSGANNRKIIILSMVSCAVMAIIFFGFVMPNVGKAKERPAQQISEEPYQRLRDAVNDAKRACGKAMQSDDLAEIQLAIRKGEEMLAAFNTFEGHARARGWSDDNFAESLRQISFPEVQGMLLTVRHRKGLVEQRGR